MVKTLAGGQRVVILGKGTTMVSDVRLDDEEYSTAILFSNEGPTGFVKAGDLPPDAVLIQMVNTSGVFSYLRALIGMLKTWPFGEVLKTQVATMEQELIGWIEAEKAKEVKP